MFNLRNDLDVLNAKSIKDLKYLGDNWRSKTWEYRTFDETVEAGPNGDPRVNSHYFTQAQRWNSEYENREDYTDDHNDVEYDEWVKMTEDVIFFDTGACMQGGHIGNANQQTFSATSTRYVDWTNRSPTQD